MRKGISGMSYLENGRRVDLEPGGKKILVSFGETRSRIDVDGAVTFIFPGPYGATIMCETGGEIIQRDIFDGRIIDQKYLAEAQRGEREIEFLN